MRELHQQILNKIIHILQEGNVPWQWKDPWACLNYGKPINYDRALKAFEKWRHSLSVDHQPLANLDQWCEQVQTWLFKELHGLNKIFLFQMVLEYAVDYKDRETLLTSFETQVCQKSRYKGLNNCVLNGIQQNYWLTFKQAKGLKLTIKKGTKGTRILFWAPPTCDQKCNDNQGCIHVQNKKARLKWTTVFNIQDTIVNEKQKSLLQQIHQQWIRLLPAKGSARWSRKLDLLFTQAKKRDKIPRISECDTQFPYLDGDDIYVPYKVTFTHIHSFYFVVFHYLGHWFDTKLDTKKDTKHNHYCCDYENNTSWKELLAEMSAGFLAADFGLEIVEHHQRYTRQWYLFLQQCQKTEPDTLMKVAQRASKVVDQIKQWLTTA